jgi:hypothetical protein
MLINITVSTPLPTSSITKTVFSVRANSCLKQNATGTLVKHVVRRFTCMKI